MGFLLEGSQETFDQSKKCELSHGKGRNFPKYSNQKNLYKPPGDIVAIHTVHTMFSSATPPPPLRPRRRPPHRRPPHRRPTHRRPTRRHPPRHNFVVSAITNEGFTLRSSNLTHALLIQISLTIQ